VSRVPPHDLEAEKSVLGAALLDRSALDEAAAVIRTEDFYQERHRVIWSAMLELRDRNEPVDLVTLTAALRSRGQLEDAGGITYLAEVANFTPTAANVLHYARIVKDTAFRRQLIRAGMQIAQLGWEVGQEVGELANRSEQLLREATDRVVGGDTFLRIGDVVFGRWQQLYEARDVKGLLGLPSGFTTLDAKTGGFMPADLVIIAARPSIGKTSLALAIAQNVAKKGGTVVFFSLEMSRAMIADRLVCAAVPLDSHLLRTRRLTEEQWDQALAKASKLAALPIFVDDKPAQTTAEMWAKARRVRNLALVIIDYLGMIGDPRRSGSSKAEHLEEVVNRLKAMARDLNVPVIVLSQLSRAPEKRADRRPELADLRDSGGIEQTADTVLLLHRPGFYDASAPQNEVEVIIAKQRNGPVGTVKLYFDPEYARFGDLERRAIL